MEAKRKAETRIAGLQMAGELILSGTWLLVYLLQRYHVSRYLYNWLTDSSLLPKISAYKPDLLIIGVFCILPMESWIGTSSLSSTIPPFVRVSVVAIPFFVNLPLQSETYLFLKFYKYLINKPRFIINQDCSDFSKFCMRCWYFILFFPPATKKDRYAIYAYLPLSVLVIYIPQLHSYNWLILF